MGDRQPLYVVGDGLNSAQQFTAIIAVSRATKRPYPLMCVCLQHGGPSPHHFSAFAPQISRSTDLVKTAMGGWQI